MLAVGSRRVRSDVAAFEVASGNQSALVLDLYVRLRSSQCISLVCVDPLKKYFFVTFCYQLTILFFVEIYGRIELLPIFPIDFPGSIDSLLQLW